MRVVSPYRRQEPESGAHVKLGAFDWQGALGMLAASARRFGYETVALSDETTDVGAVPVFRYATVEPRLMLWILEVSLAYLDSNDFDRDTVFVSPDSLIVGDLGHWFSADLTILVRHRRKFADRRPVLNSVQWWSVAARERLVAFYRQALDIARALSRSFQRWGADCEALRQLLIPLAPGVSRRAGLLVRMTEASNVLQTLPNITALQLAQGFRVGFPFSPTVVDFKGRRKVWMRQYFAASGLEAACA